MTAEIIAELHEALTRLNAPAELLSITGSHGDTLNDDDVLELLCDYNQKGRLFDQVIAQVV